MNVRCWSSFLPALPRRASAALTFCKLELRSPRLIEAFAPDVRSEAAVNDMIDPPRLSPSDATVIVLVAAASARTTRPPGSAPSSRLAPSNVAFSTMLDICWSNAWKSSLSALRDDVASEGSAAATAFSFISTRRFEIDSPAAIAMSTIDVARDTLCLTAFNAPTSPRAFCAIA